MIAFNVYPLMGDKRHYRVLVFDSEKQMHGYQEVSCRQKTARIPSSRMTRNYRGIACYRDVMAFGKRLDCRGEVHVHRRSLGAGVVAHEMTHAANYFLEKDRRMKPGSKRWDEAHATSVGQMTRQFWASYFRAYPDMRPLR